MPIIVFLHGAGASPRDIIGLLRDQAERDEFLLVVPGSRGRTWDAVHGSFGPDVSTIDRALQETFRACPVDPGRIAISGFSDGASYALSLGLINGDLFPYILAFSPGFIPAGTPHGRPGIFISHGVRDPVLPVLECRRIVPELEHDGYAVEYREFADGHTVPAGIVTEALMFFLGR